PDTFTAIAEFNACFVDKSIDLYDADYWFDVDVLGCAETRNCDSIADLSCPTKPSPADWDPLFAEQNPLREARQLDEGTSNDIMGCYVPKHHSTVAPLQYAEIVDKICRAGPADMDYNTWRNSVMSPGPRRSNPKLAKYS
ncbi:uncharacterized protein VP01_12397g1, partial [Puccinia sorghi]